MKYNLPTLALAFLLMIPAALLSQSVTFSPTRGVFTGPFQLSLTASAGSTIRYTTDGTAPTVSTGAVYAGPITISNTSVVRAISVSGATATPVATNTYLFLDNVIRQPATVPGWPNKLYDLGNDDSAIHDYAMDPAVVNDPAYSSVMIDAMKDIPTMSLVLNKTDFQNMYDGDIEVPTSVELIYPKNPAANEQFNCGIEAHSHLRLKRSMRLVIDNSYFPSSLQTNLFKNAPLNGSNAATKFSKTKFVLRAGNNRSWARNWNPDRTCYTRDQWYRDALIDVSGVGSHGTFVHLYVNGLYWGLYNPAERLDAGFEATYLGGDAGDWLNYSEGGIRSGDTSRLNYLSQTLVNKDMTVPANFTELKGYLDVTNFSDYILTTWLTGMTDWPQNNFTGGNRNNPAGPNLFFGWDAEWSWDNLGVNHPNNGAWVHPEFRKNQVGTGLVTNLWHSARKNSDFMTLFADRIYRNCFNNGKLTDSASRARWLALNNFISKAIIGESARWGDALGDGVTRTKNSHWQPEVTRVEGLMQGNVQRFITALRAEGYYPAIDAPAFSKEGGVRTSAAQLTITNPNGTGIIYYTINGEDPRLPGGGTSPNALVYSGNIALASDVTIKARIKDGTTWSAIHEGAFFAPSLKINEFLASNTATIKDEFGVYEDWIEIYNKGSQPVDLGGMYITDLLSNPTLWKIPTTDPSLTTIPAHGYKLLWADKEMAQGPLHVDVKLSASGEQIGIAMMDEGIPVYLDSLTFGAQANDVSTGLYPDGSSLVRTFTTPTPNSANVLSLQKGLYINEFVTNNVNGITDNAGDHDDWIEIYNKNPQPVNIGGWYVTNSITNTSMYQIPGNQPALTTIPANGYIILWADNQPAQGALHLGFQLNSPSGQIGLIQKSGTDINYVDTVNYSGQVTDISSGRYPDASVNFKSLNPPSPGAANTLPLITGLKINEFMASNDSKLTDENGEYDDWFEIYNSNGQPVDIGGLFVTDNLTQPGKWQIPTSRPDLTTIPAGGFLLLWADDQVTQGPLHTAIKLSGSGEQLGIVQINGSTTSFIDSLSFGPQKSDTSVGRSPNGSATIVTFNQPTPGASNVVAVPQMTLTLVNAVSDLDIQQLTNGAVINVAAVGRSLNIRANPAPGTIGSVVFVMTGTVSRSLAENVAPYALFGDVSGNYNEWTTPVGTYTLSATAYSGANGTGTAGSTLSITFTVIDQISGNQPPTANAGTDKIITLPASSVTLDGSGIDPDGSISSYAWSKISGPAVGTIVSPSSASTSVTGLTTAGTYMFRLTVTDNNTPTGATATDDVTVVVNASGGGGTVYRINAGGPQVTTSMGVFSADANFSPTPGNTYLTSSAIAGTTDDALYQTERFGTGQTFSYAFPVSNGSYSVKLHFAEIYHTGIGNRVFDISMEGVKVKDNFDVVAKVGPFTATTETFLVNVTDGTLNMYFSALAADGGVDQPKVGAIEITPASGNQPPIANAGADQTITLPTSSVTLNGSGSSDLDGSITSYAWTKVSGPDAGTITTPAAVSTTVTGLTIAGTYVYRLTVQDNNAPTKASATDDITVTVNPTPSSATIRINAGGPQITTSMGVFAADANFTPSPGNTYSTSSAIAGTTDDALYQTERFGTGQTFSYAFPLANGSYSVKLHFAEIYHTAAGQRVFDISMEGVKVKDNFDVVAKVGSFTATTETFLVNVTDGVLNMNFSALAADGGVDQPKVGAIEITSASGNQPPIANAGTDQTITLPASSVTLNGSGSSDLDGSITSYAWTKVSGPNTGTITSPGTVSTTVTGLTIAGTYVYRLTVQDNNSPVKASASDDITVTVNPTPSSATIRINAGGPQLNTSLGVFSADANFSPNPGNTYSTTSPIAGTTDDALYQTERFGTGQAFSYAFPVANGTYTVVLHFAEIYYSAVGNRIFDISMEGVKVKDNFDVFAKAGAFTATTETFTVNVTDGVLNMAFSALAADGGVDQPKVAAIEIISSGSTMATATGNEKARLQMEAANMPLQVQVSPNPSAHSFLLRLRSTTSGPVTVRIFNAVGQLMEPQRVVTANGTLQVGDNYRPGVYYIEMLHEKNKKVMKLVKE